MENKDLQELVDSAVSNNAAFFDTAERYGSNLKTAFGLGWGETEALTAKLLNQRPAIIATKFTPSPWRTTVQSVVEACEESRHRLGVEQIDLYQLHMPDIVQPFGGTSKDAIYWKGLAECYNLGLVKNVGVSNYGSTLTLQCQEALAKYNVPLASNQIAYSLLGRHNGSQQTVDTCNAVGVKVLAFFPYAMGLLTGKYNSDYSNNQGLVQSRKTSLESRELQNYATKLSPLLRVMQDIARKRKKTVSQIALNYVLSKGAIPIPGARTPRQLLDNLGAMGFRLNRMEIVRLEGAAESLGFGFDGAGFKRASEKFVGYGMERWTLD